MWKNKVYGNILVLILQLVFPHLYFIIFIPLLEIHYCHHHLSKLPTLKITCLQKQTWEDRTHFFKKVVKRLCEKPTVEKLIDRHPQKYVFSKNDFNRRRFILPCFLTSLKQHTFLFKNYFAIKLICLKYVYTVKMDVNCFALNIFFFL